MQLIRNVFLTSDKTLERKLEEGILTCLMERTEVIDKNRVLEIYLNVIEWGEGVYGIRQASRHYFGKEPGELDLNETLFLTGIIPNPRQYASFLGSQGDLSEFGEAYYAGMAFMLFEEGKVSEGELDALAAPDLRSELWDWGGQLGSEAMSGTL